MGSWNETCAISRLSISAGEEIRLLPIVLNPYHVKEVHGYPTQPNPICLSGKSGCYIGDLWSPLCYPIRGTYNDYGSVESVEESSNEAEVAQFINAFKKYAVPLEIGPNEYHDSPLKDFTLAEILEALQEGRCFMNYQSHVPQRKDRLVPIGWMMIKETVWQSLLQVDVRKSGEFFIEPKDDDLFSVDGLKKSLSKGLGAVSRERRDELAAKLENKTITTEELVELSEGMRNSFFGPRRWAWNQSPIDAPDLNESLLDIAAQMELVHTVMGLLRISYQPTSGSGSQSNNRKLWGIVNKSWQKLIAEEKRQEAAERRKYEQELKEFLAKEKTKK